MALPEPTALALASLQETLRAKDETIESLREALRAKDQIIATQLDHDSRPWLKRFLAIHTPNGRDK